MALTERSSLSPANDHWLLTSPPTTHLPGVQTATAAGPALHLRAPSESWLEVGRVKVGPKPTSKSLATEVAKKKVGLMSPRPLSEVSPFASDGWWTIGTMVRVIRFQSSESLNGTTGWMLRTFWVRSRGP